MTAERILRFRVEHQMNDQLRNPEGRWRLVFSSNTIETAEAFAEDYLESHKKFGDKVRVRDGGSETVVNRVEF